MIDSIVMSSAVIPPDATIVRSLICPGALIESGAEIADSVISAHSCLSDQGLRAPFESTIQEHYEN